MAPLRRYLRITKHSVLEVRIYLDRPADTEAWLLKSDNPALPRVIQAIRPLVLPKLREENQRGKGRGGTKAKKKGVKDVVVEGAARILQPSNIMPDDFEVSIFLTELSSRHSILTKQKTFKDKARIQSNSGKLTGWLTTGTSNQPLMIDEEAMDPIVIRDDEDEEAINLADIPEADVSSPSNSEGSDLFVPGPGTRRSKTKEGPRAREQGEDDDKLQEDDKKKLGLNTSYDGFSIYGRILCLVVKRRGARNHAGSGAPSSQAMLENWVSTQAAAEQVDDDEDGGG
ncbi:uncharacterized protein K460DRAFT_344801 [Cucurbitaria berberidis CBS 394.84]|uniref:Uncharacterized protein n=1 Tax=Cucurbitaria berberidis CBS 394.84 TaxID=1168544 RepID=A0A9P4L579_9PLEO|nr:uncharacterized protein K460DRAFT_344801 [Cucurbitaria berberidis CBS 394.84]KAF1841703.1 hypothetical protein K460DRAFT_344801 [Cucurbitaria berberidis CBS 394.84]